MGLAERLYKPSVFQKYIPPAPKKTPFFKILIKLTFYLSLATSVFLLFYKPPFPEQSRIVDRIKESEPAQTKTKLPEIEKSYKNYRYKIQPLYDYELSGLVVSEYTSDNWLDFFHKQDPANTRDLCVIWGNFIKSDYYRQVKYGHGEFTCTLELKNPSDWKNPSDITAVFPSLSNNHLIPATGEIADKINQAKVGDQIYFKGYLASYQVFSSENQLISQRGTSTIREDIGNGACETVYVTDFEVLQHENSLYWIFRTTIPKILAISSVLILVLFFLP